MEDILLLLAPGGFSWFSDASCWSRSVRMLVAMMAESQLYCTDSYASTQAMTPGGLYDTSLLGRCDVNVDGNYSLLLE